MALCECGCREEAGKGQFLPGHDQRLRTSLEQKTGGLLPLRTLVNTAAAYAEGGIGEGELTQIIRGIFSTGTPLVKQAMTCREEVLECAKEVTAISGKDSFTISEILTLMAERGSAYAESTIRTHITSRMCANAPDHHAVTYKDLERTERGTYRLLR